MRVDLCGSCELRVLYTNRGITRNSQSCTHLGPKSQHASIAAHRSLKVYANASGLWNSKTYHAISVGDLERLSPKNDFTDDESHSRQLGALLDGCSTGLVILQRHLSENGSCTCRVSHLTTPKHAGKFSLLGSPVCGSTIGASGTQSHDRLAEARVLQATAQWPNAIDPMLEKSTKAYNPCETLETQDSRPRVLGGTTHRWQKTWRAQCDANCCSRLCNCGPEDTKYSDPPQFCSVDCLPGAEQRAPAGNMKAQVRKLDLLRLAYLNCLLKVMCHHSPTCCNCS